MRVRITREILDVVDGVDLAAFEAGSVRDLPVELACYLLAIRAAEPVDDPGDCDRLPRHKRFFGADIMDGSAFSRPKAPPLPRQERPTAADQNRRRPKRRLKKK